MIVAPSLGVTKAGWQASCIRREAPWAVEENSWELQLPMQLPLRANAAIDALDGYHLSG